MVFVALLDGVVIKEGVEFADLYRVMQKERDLDRYEYDYKGELKTRRIYVRTRLSDNVINYVSIACGLNYTVGFPTELLKGVREEDIEDVKAENVKAAGKESPYDLVLSAVLSSNAESIDEALDVILKLKLDNRAEASALQAFANAVENCYNDFYAEYWRRIRVGLEERAERFERILNAIEAFDMMERITGRRFQADHLDGFVVDVFRNGGGMYFDLPNRIILTSSTSSTFMKHLDVGHEAGHIMTRGWQGQGAIPSELDLLAKRVGEDKYMIGGYIDECLAALIQLKMDERVLREKRATHGFMHDAFFELLGSIWKAHREDPEFKIEDLLLRAIGSARENDEVICGLRKRVSTIPSSR